MNDGPQSAKKNSIIIGIPSYDAKLEIGAMMGIFQASVKKENQCALRTGDCSSITRTFNTLFCEALNERKNGVTHFAMIHSDIVPEAGWLDKLLELMEKHDADVMSVIIPMKTTQGYVSTAIDQATTHHGEDHYKVSNLNMREVHRMKDATFTDPDLLVNTGLMLIDIRKPWVEDGICFRFENEILRMPDGTFKPFEISEDWYFSRQAKKRGAKLYATREVKVKHMGRAAYSNALPWGSVGVEPKAKE